MKYGTTEIKDLWDSQLLEIYYEMVRSEEKRLKAKSHEKFKKMEFAPTNPAFIELKNSIINEIRKRKLMDI